MVDKRRILGVLSILFKRDPFRVLVGKFKFRNFRIRKLRFEFGNFQVAKIFSKSFQLSENYKRQKFVFVQLLS